MRARNLKPGFFSNELLSECAPLARLLFQGLWCIADRDGWLEDRPKKIKAVCLPYDDCDIDDLLGQLASRGFIERTTNCHGRKLIQIMNFGKHQRPHHQEPSLNLNEPGENQIKPGENQAEPGEVALETAPFALNPSSLNPSSLNAEYGERESGPKHEKEFSLCPEGLAQSFQYRQRGRKEDLYAVTEEFDEAIRRGHKPDKLAEEIDGERDRAERFWQFKKRVIEGNGTNGNGTAHSSSNGSVRHAAAARRAERRRRDFAEPDVPIPDPLSPS